ncbi:MAG TPA: hypothetical protein VG125_00550 [Pirellulales bacterium]|jgi:hypothetical protein|nr:hypothetical protein [Pirellulales bacterium]
MERLSTANRQFSLRFVFWVMTGVALLCAGWSLADRWIIEKARCDALRRAESRREHDRALAEWELRRNPWSWDFGP